MAVPPPVVPGVSSVNLPYLAHIDGLLYLREREEIHLAVDGQDRATNAAIRYRVEEFYRMHPYTKALGCRPSRLTNFVVEG